MKTAMKHWLRWASNVEGATVFKGPVGGPQPAADKQRPGFPKQNLLTRAASANNVDELWRWEPS